MVNEGITASSPQGGKRHEIAVRRDFAGGREFRRKNRFFPRSAVATASDRRSNNSALYHLYHQDNETPMRVRIFL